MLKPPPKGEGIEPRGRLKTLVLQRHHINSGNIQI